MYIEKKTSLYLLCDDYVLSIADGTSVSTFLCTPGAWRRKCKPNCSLNTQMFDELTEVLLQGSKWWLPRVWNSTTYHTYLLKILA